MQSLTLHHWHMIDVCPFWLIQHRPFTDRIERYLNLYMIQGAGDFCMPDVVARFSDHVEGRPHSETLRVIEVFYIPNRATYLLGYRHLMPHHLN